MRTWGARGTVLVTALFVVMVIHALVIVMLASVRTEAGLLKTSNQRITTTLQARSAALYALETLEGDDGLSWEASHTASSEQNRVAPPTEAATVPLDGTVDPNTPAKAWVQETDDPKLRTVWGAAYDGEQWRFSTAIAVRREINPGILFGVQNTLGANRVYYRPTSGSVTAWTRSTGFAPLDYATGAPLVLNNNSSIVKASADDQGRLFVLNRETRVSQPERYRVFMLDSGQGTNGAWGTLPGLPNNFFPDPSGLTVSRDNLYLAGRDSTLGESVILSLPNPSASARFSTSPPAATGNWTQLTVIPSTTVSSTGVLTQTNSPLQLTGLESDQDGTLYAHLVYQPDSSGAITTSFARFDQSGWNFFPQPSDLSGIVGRRFLPLQVDDLGNVLTYGLASDSSPGRMYRLSTTGEVVDNVIQGTWKPIASKIPPSANLNPRNLRAVTVDTEGNMLLGFKQDEDPLFAFQGLLQYPLRSLKNELSQVLELPRGSNRLNTIEAGGQGANGELEYSPVGWF